MKILSCRMGAAALMLAAALLSGCYWDRLTGRYSETPELTDESAAVLETSELSEDDLQKQIDELKKLAQADPVVYTINSGDKIAIVVYNHPDLSVQQTTVTPDGYVGMVLVGQVKVSGLTIAQAAAAIEKALSRFIRNPRVGISPIEIVSENVTVAGAISKPGIYPIFHGMRLADLFAKAGGAASRTFAGTTVEAADLEHSLFIRNGKLVPVDFEKAIELGDPLHNLLLRRGDYIFLAARENSMVYALGEVKKPGPQFWTRNLGVLELITLAGGLNDIHWSHVIIIRGGLHNPKMFKVDFDGILAGKVPNVALKSNDIVYMPKDNISEYNVFIHKLMPTAQLINMLLTPATWMSSQVL